MALVFNVVAVYFVHVAVAVLEWNANLVATMFWVCNVFEFHSANLGFN
jgi:hypothetical protein